MKIIEVRASGNYGITVGSGVLSGIGDVIRKSTNAQRACLVSDCQVWPLYGETVSKMLQNTGFDISCFVFPSGEGHKNAETYQNLLNHLTENGLTRTDCLIALGGGVVGDLAGFAAATYLRGIPYIQVPTTLLAMVDSSVGGKTAINLPSGKNLCGVFYQPAAVLCDTDLLRTLPEDVFRDGCAEVIKYGILYDKKLFSYLESTGVSFDPEAVIARCIELKKEAVQADEFDRGARKLLNLGHSVGHAIEKCSGYHVTHGKAVAMGIAIVSRAAKCADTERICSLLEQFGLPNHTVYSADELTDTALSDKKRSGNYLDLIVPHSIGDCRIVPTPVDELKAFIEKGL